jgi:riboflavin kinase / FMN adenylyltransferase
MKTVWLPDATHRVRRLAVGEFDGVHVGHRAVIAGADSVLTFEPHPRTVVAPESAPKLLTTLEQKADLIAGLGVDELIVVPFDGDRMKQTAQDFVDRELIERLGATWVSVGENFRFGNRARGDAALLAEQTAFETRVTDMVELDGEIVSSTHIRGLVATGAVAEAARFLGAPFETRGIVAHGDKRGRTLGFPTANLVPDPALAVPDHGIYACRATVPGLGEWTAAVSIGVRPTFVTGRGILIEAYLIGYEGDCYDRELRLAFLQRIRGEKRFASVDALVEQMGRDVELAGEIAS